MKTRFSGAPVAFTEPVAGYLATAIGLQVLTPEGFQKSIEDGTDPAPADVAAESDLLTGKKVKVLLYNSQVTSPITTEMHDLAVANGIPVVGVAETIPPAYSDYVSWQLAQIEPARAGARRWLSPVAEPEPRLSVRFSDATLDYHDRRVWSDLSLEFEEPSFVAILGPERLGQDVAPAGDPGPDAAVRAERSRCSARRPGEAIPGIGYVPQHQSFDQDLPLRGRDLVQLGIDGHRWGIGRPSAAVSAAGERRDRGGRGDGLCRCADRAPFGRRAAAPADRPGDRRRPRLLLCDEPLASLDLHHQQEITDLIGGWQKRTGRTVLFVTHDVNPILSMVDRVLFVVNGRWAAGTPDEVLTSERMSDLYGSHVDVMRVHGRILVVSESTGSGFELEEPHHLPEIHAGRAGPAGGSGLGPGSPERALMDQLIRLLGYAFVQNAIAAGIIIAIVSGDRQPVRRCPEHGLRGARPGRAGLHRCRRRDPPGRLARDRAARRDDDHGDVHRRAGRPGPGAGRGRRGRARVRAGAGRPLHHPLPALRERGARTSCSGRSPG